MIPWPMLTRSYEACLRDISGSVPEVRASALRDLTSYAVRMEEDLRSGKIGALLESAFSDTSPLVRAEACVFLSFYFPHLQALPTNRETEIKKAILSEEFWTEKLARALLDEHEHVVEMALQSIGELKLSSLLGSVRQAFYSDRVRVRFQSVLAFSLLEQDVQSLGLFLELAMEDPDAEIRYIGLRLAEEYLLVSDAGRLLVKKRFKNLLSRRAKDEEPKVSFAAALFVARLWSVDRLAKPGVNEEEENSAFKTLFSLAKKSLEYQLEKAEKSSIFSAFSFASSIRKNAVPEEDVYEAICLIGELQMAEHKDRLEKLFLTKSKSPRSQMLANASRTALAYFNHPKAVESLISDLQSPVLEKKEEAAWSVLRIKLAAATPYLHVLLNERGLSVRLSEEIQKRLEG